MSKFVECKVGNSDLVKLKMVLHAMDFGETFGVTVLESQLTVFDEEEGIVTLVLDLNENLEEK